MHMRTPSIILRDSNIVVMNVIVYVNQCVKIISHHKHVPSSVRTFTHFKVWWVNTIMLPNSTKMHKSKINLDLFLSFYFCRAWKMQSIVYKINVTYVYYLTKKCFVNYVSCFNERKIRKILICRTNVKWINVVFMSKNFKSNIPSLI